MFNMFCSEAGVKFVGCVHTMSHLHWEMGALVLVLFVGAKSNAFLTCFICFSEKNNQQGTINSATTVKSNCRTFHSVGY